MENNKKVLGRDKIIITSQTPEDSIPTLPIIAKILEIDESLLREVSNNRVILEDGNGPEVLLKFISELSSYGIEEFKHSPDSFKYDYKIKVSYA